MWVIVPQRNGKAEREAYDGQGKQVSCQLKGGSENGLDNPGSRGSAADWQEA